MCSRDDAAGELAIPPCRMPWMMRPEDAARPKSQLEAAYQNTRLDHEMRLSVNCTPMPAKLTAIMVTLGSTNSHPAAIADIVTAGANMVRLNVSHRDDKWHAITVQAIREAGNAMYKSTCDVQPVGVLVDLRGPEIRTGLFRGDGTSIGFANLETGKFVRLLTDDRAKRAGTSGCFWVSYPDLARASRVGNRILIDRGAVILEATCIGECSVICKVVKGGRVEDEKLVQLIDTAVDLPRISEQDDAHIKLALQLECDFVTVNHARDDKMVLAVKDRVARIGTNPICVLAKICSLQGIENFDGILKAADGIVFDRAGVEVDVRAEKLFIAQKSVVAKCNRMGKPIVVTFPARPGEPIDAGLDAIANAVLDGADAVHLATGNLNARETRELVERAGLACREAENARWQRQIFDELGSKARIPLDPAHSVAVGAVETSLKCNAAAIVVTTTTGRSATLLSIYRPRCPIVAVTRYGCVSRWLRIYFGIHPYHYREPPAADWTKDMESRVQSGINYLRNRNYIVVGDAIVVVSGWRQGSGFTNCIRVVYASPGLVRNAALDFEKCW